MAALHAEKFVFFHKKPLGKQAIKIQTGINICLLKLVCILVKDMLCFLVIMRGVALCL